MALRALISTLFLLASAAAAAAPELSGHPEELKQYLFPDPETVTVRGTASETAYSDLAHVTLVVSTREKTLTEALERNSALRSELTARFVAAGIPGDRINNTQFSSSPQYGWFGRKPAQFEVVNRLKVTVESEAQLATLARAADADDAVSVGAIEFEHSREQEVEQRVREAALEDAVRKSAGYAEKLGLRLRPVTFRYTDTPHRPPSSGIIEEIVVTGKRLAQDQAVAVSAPSVTFDEIEYRSYVDVTFEVLPAEGN